MRDIAGKPIAPGDVVLTGSGKGKVDVVVFVKENKCGFTGYYYYGKKYEYIKDCEIRLQKKVFTYKQMIKLDDWSFVTDEKRKMIDLAKKELEDSRYDDLEIKTRKIIQRNKNT